MSSESVANHTGPRILESPLKHCDSAQRATTGQPGATPQVLSATMRFALKGRDKTALWNPFRVRVRMVREPGAAFIRIRGFSCPRLICASLSGSFTASSKYSSFVVRARPRTSFRAEPKNFAGFSGLACLLLSGADQDVFRGSGQLGSSSHPVLLLEAMVSRPHPDSESTETRHPQR